MPRRCRAAHFAGAPGDRNGRDIAAWWHAFNDPVLDGLIARVCG
jgi:outer membrane protein TolC